MGNCYCTGECRKVGGRCPNQDYFPTPLNSMGNMGWVCPKCNKVHAPYIPGCNCHSSLTYETKTMSASAQSDNRPSAPERIYKEE